MVLLLPEAPRRASAGTTLAQGLGAGLAQGASQGVDFAMKMALEKHKINQRKRLIDEVKRGGSGRSDIDVGKLAGRTETSENEDFSPNEPDPFERAEAYAAIGEHELAKIETEKAKFMQEKSGKRADKILDQVDASRKTLEGRKTDYQVAENAIKSNPGDVGSLKNFAAKSFGLDPAISNSAATFGSAMKDAFIESLKGTGSRPNQWIEQQIQLAMPGVGKSDEANLSILSLGKFKMDLEEQFNNIVDNIEDQYAAKGLPVPGDIGKRAHKQMKPYVEHRQKELAFDLRQLHEKTLGLEGMEKSAVKTVPQGTPLTPEMGVVLLAKVNGDHKKAKQLAQKLGYEFLSDPFLVSKGYEIGEE